MNQINKIINDEGTNLRELLKYVDKVLPVVDKAVLYYLVNAEADLWLSDGECIKLYEEMEESGVSPFGLVFKAGESTGIYEEFQEWEAKVAKRYKVEGEVEFLEPDRAAIKYSLPRGTDLDFDVKMALYGLVAMVSQNLNQDINPTYHWTSEIKETTVEHTITFPLSYGS